MKNRLTLDESLKNDTMFVINGRLFKGRLP